MTQPQTTDSCEGCRELAKSLKAVEYLNGVILNLKDTIRELRLALGQEDRR